MTPTAKTYRDAAAAAAQKAMAALSAARSAAARDDAYETTVALEAAYLDAYRAMLIAYHGDDTCIAYKTACIVYRDAYLAFDVARFAYLDAEAACYESALLAPLK